MNREQLAHVLRAASGIVDDPDILVIGSQSLLASYHEDELPLAATASMEVDLAYFDDPDDLKADTVDGAIASCPRSTSHSASTPRASASAPPYSRTAGATASSTGPTTRPARTHAAFLEPHDSVVSKLVAYRDKDRAFAQTLLHTRLIDITTLRSRVDTLPPRWTPTSRTSYIPGSTRRNSNNPTTTTHLKLSHPHLKT